MSDGQLNNIEEINAKKVINKILPNGKPSGLSLNQFKVYRTKNSKWNGFSGQEIYSIEIFKQKVFEIYPQYKLIPDFDVLNFIENNYKTDIKIKKKVEDFIDGLANIILSLHEGNEECIRYNKNLFEYDWEFWKKCENIILDGKIISGRLGEELVNLLFNKIQENLCNIKILRVSDFVDLNTASLLGCSCENNYDIQYVFDFGNTAVKRGIAIKNRTSTEITELEVIYHDNFWKLPDSIESGIYIDNFIVKVILETISEFDKKIDEIINISLCIANNIVSNCIADRGCYRFLRLVGYNYKAHLTKRLEDELNRKVNVHIYNDAEAVGRIFLNFSPNTAIITLGTLLGIAYPPRK